MGGLNRRMVKGVHSSGASEDISSVEVLGLRPQCVAVEVCNEVCQALRRDCAKEVA